jgi:hypothetical protein
MKPKTGTGKKVYGDYVQLNPLLRLAAVLGNRRGSHEPRTRAGI